MTFRQVLFQVHWALGITAGLILAVVGVTGAMMSFEDEIMVALSRDVATVAPRPTPRLTVPQLVARFYATQPNDTTLAALTVESDERRLPQVKYTLKTYDERAIHYNYIDPYDAVIGGKTAGKPFFEKVREIHRWMLLPDRGAGRYDIGPGRWLTMITAISLIFFCLSGLFLRWPRRALDWRAWFKIDFAMTGRNLYRSLHAVIGSWLLVVYLLSAVTGLWWSFGDLKSWYRDAVSTALTGHAFTQGEGDGGISLPHDLSRAWAGFQAARPGDYERVTIEIREANGPVRFRVIAHDARHDRAWDTVRVNPVTGRVLSDDRYGMRNGEPIPTGEFIVANMLAIHTGGFFGLTGRILLLLSSALMPLFSVTGLLLYLDRRRKKRALRAVDIGPKEGDGTLLVVHASQTRRAEILALQTAAALGRGGRAVDVLPIARLTPEALAHAKTILLIASTYGDGEPPDSARVFARRMLGFELDLSHLSFGVIALGDRQYPQFCSFGCQLAEWLGRCGAKPLFDLATVDGEDEAAIESWRRNAAGLGAKFAEDPVVEETFGTWRLIERRELNAGSPGLPAFHVALLSTIPADWKAGDIAAIQCPEVGLAVWREDAAITSISEDAGELALERRPSLATTAPTTCLREYSIASIPRMGRLELIVRQVRRETGGLGTGSGWLTQRAPLGTEVSLSLRANPAFRMGDSDRPAILIGNGTGLAGLLAHIREGAMRNGPPMWLMYGERTRAHDRMYGEELDALVASGVLAHIDYAFSRDSKDGRYVQDLIIEQRERLVAWVSEGAAIFVCGSLAGMAPAVDSALRNVLGVECVDDLIDEGRYRRDIY